MSACTLLNGEEQWADGTTHLHESDENKPEKGNEETNAYDTEEEEEDLEAADLPIIHLINRSDSVKAICLKYNLESRLFERINQFSEFTEEIYTKRKFVVIPSTRTFTHYLFEAEQELVKNFCLLFGDLTYEQGDFYLSRAGYNLAIAIENYHYDIC